MPTFNQLVKQGRKSVAKKSSTKQYAKNVLKYVNKERKKAGLKPLKLDTKLCQAANGRAKEIKKKFSHTRPNGKKCFSILKEYGLSPRAMGENIAAGQTSAKQVVKAWMNSKGHRENILSKDFKKMGIGKFKKADSKYKVYWAQLFSS